MRIAVPTGYPQGFQIQPLTPYSVVALWEPPFISDQNGIITNYTIRWTLTPSEGESEYTTTNTNITVSNLTPHTTYVWTIAASTSVGIGPYSTAVNILMPEAGTTTISLK